MSDPRSVLLCGILGLTPKVYLVLGCNDGWEEGGHGRLLLRGKSLGQGLSYGLSLTSFYRLEPSPEVAREGPEPSTSGSQAGSRRMSSPAVDADGRRPLDQKEQQERGEEAGSPGLLGRC